MWLTVCLASFIVGVVVTLLLQSFFIRRHLLSLPVERIPHKPQYSSYTLPKFLQSAVSDLEKKDKKESCIALNLIIHFLFKELRDTTRVRRWVTKKINMEFNDMLQSTTGRLIEKITLRDFNLGPAFPVIKCVAVDSVKFHKNEFIEEVDIMADIDYSGGFQLAMEIDLVFKKWAYLSVTVTKLKGTGRLQFTQKPYTHWSFTFFEDPDVEFEVESKFGGRPVPQVASLIISQIKRILKKKHTLPHYKMRYKPFFTPPEESMIPKEISVKGNVIGHGQLEVKVMSCTGLLIEHTDSYLFCTLSVDKLRWLEYEELRKKVWVVYEVKIVKGTAQSIGLTFKEDFMLEKYEDVVVVDKVVPDSPAAATDIRKGDVLVSVGMTRITSVAQAGKILRNVTDRVTLRLERAKTGATDDIPKIQEPDIKAKEPIKDEYVNIVIKPCDTDDKVKDTGSTNQINSDKNISTSSQQSSPHRKVLSLVNSGKALLQRRVKSHTVSEMDVSTSASNFLDPEEKNSGHRISKSMDTKQLIDSINGDNGDVPSSLPNITQTVGLSKKRTQSDPGFIVVSSREPSDNSSSEDEDHVDGLPEPEKKIDSQKSSDKHGIGDMQRTSEVRSQKHPEWYEDFLFTTGSEDRYLNVCVWCRIPSKLDKHEKVIKPGRETLLGHVSLPISDVTFDCLLTIQGDSQRCIKLVPPENVAGVSRTKFPEYMSHPGFDNRMCHGDITLGFTYRTVQTLPTERVVPEVKVVTDKESSAEVVSLEQVENLDKLKLEIGKHDFTATQFASATFCQFCGKKIWLKDAFQCSTCSMICHKKCVVKCQTQTLCTKDGAMMRSTPSESWKAPVPEPRRRQKSGSGGILSKFRNTNVETKQEAAAINPSPVPSPNPSPQPSPQPSPKIRRRNSAPGTDDVKFGTFLDTSVIPQTRSSTSIQTLLNTAVLPRRLSEELFGNKYKGDSSEDSDSESSTFIQLSKRAKGQNLDEMVVTAAKEMGKELYAELSLEERKEKLDAMVSKFQKEIDIESENKTEMIKEEMVTVDPVQKEALKQKISKSDEKVEALMMMMLHYCAGLQYCMEEEEEERQKAKDKDPEMFQMTEDGKILTEKTNEVNKLTERILKDSELNSYTGKVTDNLETSGSDSTFDLIQVESISSSADELTCRGTS